VAFGLFLVLACGLVPRVTALRGRHQLPSRSEREARPAEYQLERWGTSDARPERPAPSSKCLLLVVDGPTSVSQGVEESVKMAVDYGCEAEIWSVGVHCQNFPGQRCVSHPNLGRDLGAAVHFILERYDDLPERLLVTSSSLAKWDRSSRLKQLFDNLDSHDFECPILGNWSPEVAFDAGFNILCYNRTELTPAEPYGLLNWALAHVKDDLDVVQHTHECFNGLWRSTRELLLERPKSFYQDIAQQLDVSAANEAVHYAERLAALIFGGHGLRRKLRKKLAEKLQLRLERRSERRPCEILIAVPYRNQLPVNDRQPQLALFTRAMDIFLKQMHATTGCTGSVYVVEQSQDGRRFNRGYLANAAFKLAMQHHPHISSFIFHDVDLLPSDLMLPTYADQPTRGKIVHLAHVLAKYPYGAFIGGAFAIQPKDFWKTNGFPNTCWGWGNEDDYFMFRLNTNNVSVQKTCTGSYNDTDPVNIGAKWKQGKISRDLKNQLNPVKVAAGFSMPSHVDEFWRTDGLSSANFTVLGTRTEGVATVFTVELHERMPLTH